MERVMVPFQATPACRRHRTRRWVLGVILVLATTSGAVFGQAVRPATAGQSAAPLARYVPRQDLFFYLEFDGLDAHADAWKHSAAYKLLNDTKLGALLEDLTRQGIE